MKGKILITGASGFVGGHLAKKAKSLGLEVHAAVRTSSNIDQIKPFTDKFQYLDYEDVNALISIFNSEKYQYIVHAAAMTTAKSEATMVKVNVDYTLNLITAAFDADHDLKRFVYVSSLAAIGPQEYNETLIVEETEHNPITMYGRSKSLSEKKIHAGFMRCPITIIRPTVVYGPNEKDLFILFDTMNRGLEPYIGKDKQKLSFIHVEDLVNVLIKACEQDILGVATYNVTDGNVYSRYAMAEIFKKTFNKKLFRIHLPVKIIKIAARVIQGIYKNSAKVPVLYPERVGELTAQNWACDIQKVVNDLDFKSEYNLQEGLKETLLWYKANKWL